MPSITVANSQATDTESNLTLYWKSNVLLLIATAGMFMMTVVVAGQSQPTEGGIFIPRNGGYEGRIGKSHVFFSQGQGGSMSIVKEAWPQMEIMASVDMVFQLKKDGIDAPIQVKQSFDKNPKILFLEEGNNRIGIRTLFKLYDIDNIFHGHGMTETWLHPDGQMFVTAAAMFENRAAHNAITKAHLDITLEDDQRNSELKITDMASPHNHVLLTKPNPSNGTLGLSLYWRTGKMEHNTYVYRSSFGFSGSPSYFRWPDYHRQAYTQRTLPDYIDEESERAKWPPGRGAYVHQLVPVDNGVQLQWPIEADKPNPTASFNAFFRMALVPSAENAQALVASEQSPIVLAVDGGVVHGKTDGYNDQEGCYEIRKTGTQPTSIKLPSDPLKRTVRIKVIGLTGHGAVTATLDGRSLIPQLSTDGGIADDPLAPIHEQPEAPANAALVTVKLGSDPQTLIVREQDGIQLVYQSRDPRRNYMVYSTKTGPRWSGMQLSLLDGHARRIRAYGSRDWALTENLMHWFAYMGYSPEQMLDQLRDFQVIKNGPDEIVFKYISNNSNDGAQSEFLVSMEADAPVMQMHIRATFRVLEHWPYKSVQYFDVFPFRGVEPKDWWYDYVLFMDSDKKWRSYKTDSQTYQGQQDKQSSGSTFQGMFSSERGNMLMLTKNFSPNLPTHYVICSNYVDLHSNVLFDDVILQPTSLQPGYEVSVEYELAIWGDENLTREQLIKIAENSIDEGQLVFPDN